MPLLLIVTLVPTLSFYCYVLAQFVREAGRRRMHDTCALIVPLRSETARRGRPAQDPPMPVFAQQTHRFQADDPDRIKFVVTQPKNRLASYQGEATTHLAVKHTAKG